MRRFTALVAVATVLVGMAASVGDPTRTDRPLQRLVASGGSGSTTVAGAPAAAATSTITLVGDLDGDVRRLPPVAGRPHPKGDEEAEPAYDRPGSPTRGVDQNVATIAGAMPATSVSFQGLSYNGAGTPPDAVGDVGPNHYIEAVNTMVGIYSKTGVSLASFTFDTLWAGQGTLCDGDSYGDPTVVYDPMHDRWIVADFAFTDPDTPPFYECIAVSKTGDPVAGGWWFYALRADDATHPWLPDYPKMAVWPGSLLMTANMFSNSYYAGAWAWAINLADIESGVASPRLQIKNLGPGYFSLMPANMRGAAPPAGSPAYLVAEDVYYWAYDVWKWSIDWSTNTSTLSSRILIGHAVSADITGDVPQNGTTQTLDTLSYRLMMQAQYRNLGGTESIWVANTVGTSGPSATGVQWAQLNVTGGTVATSPVQQGIWSGGGDGLWRWMPSLAVDGQGNMAIGYSVSGTSLYPGLRAAGRLAGDPLGTLGQGEATLLDGTAAQTGIGRWGDYFAMSVDPVDDCTFWFVGEYVAPDTGRWTTRVVSFAFPSCVAAGPSVNVLRGGTGAGKVTSSPVGIDCGSTCNATFTAGDDVTLTAVAAAGSTFDGWSGPDAGSCSGTTCTFSAMSSTRSVTATFTPIPPSTISITRIGSGTVSSSPRGISCGSTCSYPFTYGTGLTLTATAASGYVFGAWSGDCVGSTRTCVLTMDAAKSVTATFGRQLTLTKTTMVGGTVTSDIDGIACGTTCSSQRAVFTNGQVVVLTAVPEPGYSFKGWTGNCSGVASTCTLTMSAARSVTATFGVALSLTKNAAARGSISSSPSGLSCGTSCTSAIGVFAPGTTVTLSASIARGYSTIVWSGCTPVPSRPRKCTVVMSAAASVTATIS